MNGAKAASTANPNQAKIGLSRCLAGVDNRKDDPAPDDRGGMIFLQLYHAAPRDGTGIVLYEASTGFVSSASRWSSGKWWKARGMATVRPDQAELDSYVDLGIGSMGGSVAGVKASTDARCRLSNMLLKRWTTVEEPDARR